jgi:hypothetical protein
MVEELTMTKRKGHLSGSQLLASYLQYLQAHSPSTSFENISPTLVAKEPKITERKKQRTG